jgi:hemoglobin
MSDATKAILTRAESAGGLDAISALIRRCNQKLPRDPLLAPVFARIDPHHDEHVAAFIAEVSDGPKAYTGEGGSHAQMIGRQLGHHLTEDLCKRWLALRLGTADEISLFSAPEFRAALVGYREWGTWRAVMNSQDGVTPPEDAPMRQMELGTAGRAMARLAVWLLRVVM